MNPLDHLSGQRVLVTGATGFLGSHVYEELKRHKIDVHATYHQSRGSLARAWWKVDLRAVDQVRELLQSLRPDTVFHLAGCPMGSGGLNGVVPTFAGNTAVTVNMLAAAAETGCRRIVIPASLEELPEDYRAGIPLTPYGASKRAATMYARMFFEQYNTPVVIVRPFMAYGPRQHPSKVIPYVILSLLEGKVPHVYRSERMVDWVYVDDVTRGILAAAVAPGIEGSTFDLGSGSQESIRSVVTQIQRMLHTSVDPEFHAVPDRTREPIRTAETGYTHKQLHWKATTPLSTGLHHTIAWYKLKHRNITYTLSVNNDQ